MLNKITEIGCYKMNATDQERFHHDLTALLHTLERCKNLQCDHVDYVKRHKYFIDTWSPKD